MRRNPVTEFDNDSEGLCDFIKIDGCWVSGNWHYEEKFDDVSYAAAKEMAFHRRQDSGAGVAGIDGIEPGNCEADDNAYETTTIIARDGTHFWNRTAQYRAHSNMDLNDSLRRRFFLP